jgi:hypothetical protein
MANPVELDRIPKKGADKARVIAVQTLSRVRKVLGY